MTSQSTRVVKEAVLPQTKRLLFYTLTVLSLLATVAFIVAWIRLDVWRQFPVMFPILSLIIFFVLGSIYGRWILLPQMKKPRPLEVQAGWKVAVVTTIVPDVEPLRMLENTLEALVALDYSHETWVLDEGDDQRVKELCLKQGVFYFSRKTRPQYQTETGLFRKATKYGNYNAWLYEIGFERYDFIAAFDPDHVPEPTFLLKILGYFNDTKIGYVQAPQMYSNQNESFIARGAAEESYGFNSYIQMASYGLGYPIIIGCHNTHRMSALREVGGFAPHDADDLLLTLLYQNRGWEGVYVPEVLAGGLAPVDWSSFLNQQRRWARSLLDIKLKIAPRLLHKLSFSSRLMNVLHGFLYLHRACIFPIMFLLLAVMLVRGRMPEVMNIETLGSLGLLLVILIFCDRFRKRFYLDKIQEKGVPWRAGILQFAKWPYLFMAFFDVILERRFPYMITSKIAKATSTPLALWPHIFILIMIVLAWGIGLSIQETIPAEVQFCAGTVVMITLALLATEWYGVF